MEAVVLAVVSVLAVSLVSLVGLAAGARVLSRHLVMLTLVAVAAGSLLGDALLHLGPEAAELWEGWTVELSLLMILGFIAFFGLETVLRLQHSHAEALSQDGLAHGHAHRHDHGPDHDHGHHPPDGGARKAGRVAPFAWMNLAGDVVHNFLDGIVIAAAYLVDVPLGVATTVAVALHEIPQELGDFAVLVRGGLSRRKALLYNFATALTALLGALVFLALPFDPEALEKYALPITAGGFLYIAAADLVPELHHHAGDRHALLILAGLVAGIGMMFGLLALG